MNELTLNDIHEALGIFALPITLIAIPVSIGYFIGKKIKNKMGRLNE